MVLVKTYIESLPNEIEDAIFIDGGTEFDAYFKIIFFITLPVNAAIMLFTAIAHWNSFMDVQLYNYASPNLHTLQYVLYNVLGKKISQSLESAKNLGQVKANAQSIKMAISVITIVPIMMLYPLLQKYFISGMMIGSIKA
jgi:putative aldouronate transport system permease protein